LPQYSVISGGFKVGGGCSRASAICSDVFQ